MTKNRGATYKLLYGEQEGERLSRIQGQVVRAGTMLQNAIRQMTTDTIQFQGKLKDPTMHRTLKADLITQNLAIELKLGFEFDTKKAAREVEDIKHFARLLSVREQREIRPAICLFQANSVEDMKGFKTDTTGVEMITGRDLCARLDIVYEEVLDLVRTNALAEHD